MFNNFFKRRCPSSVCEMFLSSMLFVVMLFTGIVLFDLILIVRSEDVVTGCRYELVHIAHSWIKTRVVLSMTQNITQNVHAYSQMMWIFLIVFTGERATCTYSTLYTCTFLLHALIFVPYIYLGHIKTQSTCAHFPLPFFSCRIEHHSV